MSYSERRQKPADDTVYHVFNRGVEKKNIFNNNDDRERFLTNLIIFNDSTPSTNTKRQCAKSDFAHLDQLEKADDPLVQILAYCLMPNHYHLILKSVADDGITEFMRKLGTGYTNYFNKKHERVGALFQGKFKSQPVEDDNYLQYLIHYIHLNPLDLKTPEWHNGKIISKSKALDFIKEYPWSSYQECLNCAKSDFAQGGDKSKNDPLEIVDWEALADLGITKKDCLDDTFEWLTNENLEAISDLIIE